MKSFLLTTLILIVTPTLIFVPVYIFLIYNANANIRDYSAEIQGQWTAFQYYYEGQRVACNEETWMSLSFDENTVTLEGTVLPATTSTYEWESFTMLKYQSDGETVTFLLSLDEDNNLEIRVDGTTYIILLRKAEGD